MATYRVLPLPDNESQRYGWKVQKDSRKVSTHYKKSGAKRKAKQRAGEDGTIILHRLDGTVQG